MTHKIHQGDFSCKPQKLGIKHVAILVQQGIPEQYVRSYNVTGRFVVAAKPEHLKDCPYCGHPLLDEGDGSLIMSPLICMNPRPQECGKTIWVYCDLKDSLVNFEAHREKAERLGVLDDPQRGWDEHGIPAASLGAF